MKAVVVILIQKKYIKTLYHKNHIVYISHGMILKLPGDDFMEI